MTKYPLFIVLVAFLASSCATQRKCFDKWAMKPDTVKTVSIRDSVIFKDTTVYVYIPGKVVVDSVRIPCPPPPKTYIPDTAIVRTDFAIAKAWFDYPVIKLYLEQKDKLLRLKLDSALRESWHWRTEYMNITQVLKERYVPKIYKQALSICIVLFSVIFILIGFRLYRFFKK